jgi:hypothetical protein
MTSLITGNLTEIVGLVVGLPVAVWYSCAFVRLAIAGGERAAPDRRTLADRFLVAVATLLLAWLWVPWQYVPPPVWAALAGIVVYGVLRAAAGPWRSLPWVEGPKPVRQLADTAVGGVLVAALVVLVLS